MTGRLPTAPRLLAALRRAGITLTCNGDRLAFDAPAGAVTPQVRAMLKARKPELMAVLGGDYLHAALALVAGVADAEERAALAEQFDERVAICQQEGISRGEGQRVAYRELARAVDRAAPGWTSVTLHRPAAEPATRV